MSHLVEIGINLTNKRYNHDRDEVVKRGIDAGVSKMILTGTSERTSLESFKYVKNSPYNLYSTAGIHPHDAKHFSEKTRNVLKNLLVNEKVVAVGECGLDFDRNFSSKDEQEKAFISQLELSRETGKPLFLHERDAHKSFVEIMRSHEDLIPKSVVHCFTGGEAEVLEYLEMGFYIGITGWICNASRSDALRAAVKHIPLDRLMIETDGPFLTPRGIYPKPKDNRNEPAFLPYVAASVAEFMGHSIEDVIEASTKNAISFFNLK
jgi:TatD DNase family protein